MANDFEKRWYDIVRYSINKHKDNKEKLKECNIIFIGVPTPTKARRFDWSILFDAVKNTSPWQMIVIKSTVIPWTTDKLQELYPDRYFFHSWEFLTEKNAEYDVSNPTRNVVGYTKKSKQYAEQIMNILPKSKEIYCTAKESELWKYFSNFLLIGKVIMANIMYDICKREGVEYDNIKNIASLDPRIWTSHLDINHFWGRGANWHCFPKDIATLQEYYNNENLLWQVMLEAMQMYNLDINLKSKKQLDIITNIYYNGN